MDSHYQTHAQSIRASFAPPPPPPQQQQPYHYEARQQSQQTQQVKQHFSPPPPPPPPPVATTPGTASALPPPPPPAVQSPSLSNPYAYNKSSNTIGSGQPVRRGTTTATSTPGAPRRATPASPYLVPPSTINSQQEQLLSNNHENKKKEYKHNIPVGITLGLCLVCLYLPVNNNSNENDATSTELQLFFATCLTLYAVDLANLKDAYITLAWLGLFVVMALVHAWTHLAQHFSTTTHFGAATASSSSSSSSIVIVFMVVSRYILVESLLFGCLACWASLQSKWLYKSRETARLVKVLEQMLHATLIPLSSCIGTIHISFSLAPSAGDTSATLMPHVFAVLLAVQMVLLGCVCRSSSSSSRSTNHNNSNKITSQQQEEYNRDHYCISSLAAKAHILMLLLVPGAMHLSMHLTQRILSPHASWDEVYNLVLVWTIPYLLLYGIQLLDWHDICPGPYRLPLLFGSNATAATSTLLGALFPMLASVAASLAAQQKFLVPLCQRLVYNFHAQDLASPWIVSSFWTGAILTSLFAAWVHGRKSITSSSTTAKSSKDETSAPAAESTLLFGEYQDDVVQLTLALSGLCIGKAIGLPWSLTPLPILALLGLVIWMTTRMFRYLVMVLFVLHSTGMVLWSYRYAGMDNITIPIIFNLDLSLFRFGMLNVSIGLLIFTTTGLAVRSSGGTGHAWIQRFDLTGLTLVVYTVSHTVLECTLLKHPVPFSNLMGVEGHPEEDYDSQDQIMLYSTWTAQVTSLIVGGLAIFLQHYKIISSKAALATISLAVGKIVALFIDSHMDVNLTKSSSDPRTDAMALFVRILGTSGCLLAMTLPHAILEPIRFKLSSRRRSQKTTNTGAESSSSLLPKGVYRNILLYALVLLPLTLLASVPHVLRPLVGILSGRMGGAAYYHISPAVSETVGFAAALWGVALLSMLNHYLPDAVAGPNHQHEGVVVWKKTAALTFLMGLGIALSAPTVPDWITDMIHPSKSGGNINKSSPFAAMSSVGSKLVSSATTGTTGNNASAGGWGLLAASLATLLAVTGPLELQERKSVTGRKDQFVLLRLMIFSLLFGCGVSWFITMQSMSEEDFLPVFLTSTACMAMSFFGTVAGVLGYSLEPDQAYDEVEDVLKVYVGAFPIFGVTAAISQLSDGAAHLFGLGGWLSTYLAVNGLVSLAFTLVMRAKSDKTKATRGLGNSSCVFSWACWIVLLYGRFGVAGLDASYGVTTTWGLPASVVGTLVASLILLLLEGESSSSSSARRGRRTIKGSTTTSRTKKAATSWLCLNLSSSFNYLAAPITSIATVLVLGSIYAIFIRGCGLLAVAKSHGDVYRQVFGEKKESVLDLALLAEKTMAHNTALHASAKLAGASFWTAASLVGPLVNAFGLILVIVPSLHSLVQYLWGRASTSPLVVSLLVPLNLVAIIMCRGVPTLRAAGFLGLIGGIAQLVRAREKEHTSKMRI